MNHLIDDFIKILNEFVKILVDINKLPMILF